MNKLLMIVFFLTSFVKLNAQEIPIHLLRTEDSTLVGQLIAPHLDEFGEFTYHSIDVIFVDDSTMLIGGDTIIHSGNIQNYASSGGSNNWYDLIGVPDSIVYETELSDSTAAIRADFPPTTIDTDDQTADEVDIVDGAFINSDVEAALDILHAQDVADDDKDDENELQTLSYTTANDGTINLSGQTGTVSQSEINYWDRVGTEVHYPNSIYVGGTFKGGAGAEFLSGGVADMNDTSNSYPGWLSRLWRSNEATNMPFSSTRLNHTFNIEYAASKTGLNNVTQVLYPYSNTVSLREGMYMRGRTNNNWTGWYQVPFLLYSTLQDGDVAVFNSAQSTWTAKSFDEISGGLDNYFDYDSNLDVLYNNTGSKLGINTLSPEYALHVTSSNFITARFGNTTGSSLYVNNNQNGADLRNFSSGTGEGLRFSSINSTVNIYSDNKEIKWHNDGVLQFQDTDLSAATSTSFTGSLGRDENSDRIRYHDGTGYQTLAFLSEVSGGGASNLSDVLIEGNAANNDITNLTAGTADTDAANVGQTYYDITTTEQVADYKYGGQTVYVRKLAVASIANNSTVNFTSITGFVRLVDMDVRLEYSGGIAKAGGSTHLLTNSGSNIVHAWESGGVVSIQNSGGTTISNVDIYVYYTK